MKPSERLSPEEQTQYILLDDTGGTNYLNKCSWKPGTLLKRISIWYGSNGAGRDLKQAYFVPADSNSSYGQIAWSDHVKEITDQLEFEL